MLPSFGLRLRFLTSSPSNTYTALWRHTTNDFLRTPSKFLSILATGRSRNWNSKPGRALDFVFVRFHTSFYAFCWTPTIAGASSTCCHCNAFSARGHIKKFSNQATTASLDKNLKSKEKKTKTLEPVKVFLISESDSVSLVTLEEAEKIARKKGSQLVQIEKQGVIKTDKHVYKLAKQFEEAGLRKEKSFKGRDAERTGSVRKVEKTLILHTKIAEHDVLSKVKNMSKWIQKGHEVRVHIGSGLGQGRNNADAELTKTKAESIFGLVEQNILDVGRIVQKRQKGSELRFQVLPLSKPKEGSSTNAASLSPSPNIQGTSSDS